MKASEVRPMSESELSQALEDNVEELYNLRFQKAAERIENSGRMREIRKDIARIKTIVRERSGS